ncbi:hypothetical protein [Aeoliella sp. SH292]|uniref:hypothetical protein n=1 Tax=Aeoliella sp. SH292 TaxID=3454464 RepID=UPI003F9532A9
MKQRLFIWFWVGFVVSFVLLGLLLKTFVMMPDGGALRRTSLLAYYATSINQMIEPRPLGPATQDPGDVAVVFLEHAGLSLGGGGLALLVGWIVERVRSKTKSVS